MKYRVYRILLLAVFSAALVAPLLWLGNAERSEIERRTLAHAPRLPQSLSQIVQYAGEWEAYFNDQYGFRNSGIRLEEKISAILGSSVSRKVVLGKEGWLFFAGGNNDRPLEDYMGSNLFSENELEQWARVLSRRSDRLAARGIRYGFVIVPNKATIYPEYLPVRYARVSEVSRREQLVAYLRRHTDVRVVDVQEELLRGKQAVTDFGPFGQFGTHWNAYGAALGYNAIAQGLGLEEGRMEAIRYDHEDFELRVTGIDTDLARLALMNLPDTGCGPVLKAGPIVVKPETLDARDLGLENDIERVRFDSPNSGYITALAFGDSFFWRLADYLQRHFGQLDFIVLQPTTRELLRAVEMNPVDLVIEQRVERYLWRMPGEEK